MISWSNLPWQAWMYLATLRGMDAGQALAHAQACPACTDRVAAISRTALGRAA